MWVGPNSVTTGRPNAAAKWRGPLSVVTSRSACRTAVVELAGRVADFGYEAEVTEFRSNGRTMYRVRVEGFATRERAEVASSSLAAHGIIPADVVPAD